MYAYFKGIIEEKYEDGVVIEVNGIGYNILMPNGNASILPPIGQEVRIYTYTSVREDAINLYGFTRHEELHMFKMLITVNGIGPKVALGILSALSVDDIRRAIIAEDTKLLCQAPGVGKKSAERAFVDLKDKIKKEELSYAEDFVNGISKTDLTESSTDTQDANDAIDALVALGIAVSQARSAVSKAVAAGISGSDNILKEALKFM